MGTNCAPLLADLFLYSYEAKFIKKNLYVKKINHSLWPSTFRYIDDVLLINNCYFYTHVDSIYPSELEIKRYHRVCVICFILEYFTRHGH